MPPPLQITVWNAILGKTAKVCQCMSGVPRGLIGCILLQMRSANQQKRDGAVLNSKSLNIVEPKLPSQEATISHKQVHLF
jgi:hypothetical protein